MNRKIILLSTALMAAMMLSLVVAPAIAKPNTLTVVVKNSIGKPVSAYVLVWESGILVGFAQTSDRGVANINTSNWPSAGNFYIESHSSFGTNPVTGAVEGRGTLYGFTTFQLSNQMSARIVLGK